MSFDELDELENELKQIEIEKPIVKEETTTKVTITETKTIEKPTRTKTEIINEAKLVSNNLDNIEKELDKELSKLSELEKELDNNKEELEEINEVRKNTDLKPIEEEIQETKDNIEDLENSKEIIKTTFDRNLDSREFESDIELVFNQENFSWNSFETLIKRNLKTDYNSYNIIITQNGLYFVCFVDMLESITAINIIQLWKTRFDEFNYNYSSPLVLKLEAKGFTDILKIIKDRSKIMIDSKIGFRILKANPTRFEILVKNDLREISYSIPFFIVIDQKVSKLIGIMINEME
jgi:hypothetical protein